jgi:hypothetical protein
LQAGVAGWPEVFTTCRLPRLAPGAGLGACLDRSFGVGFLVAMDPECPGKQKPRAGRGGVGTKNYLACSILETIQIRKSLRRLRVRRPGTRDFIHASVSVLAHTVTVSKMGSKLLPTETCAVTW